MPDGMREIKRETSNRYTPGTGRGRRGVVQRNLSFHDVLVYHKTRYKFRLWLIVFHVETLLDLDRAGAEGRLTV